jgi:chorismate dehydratase
MPLGDFGIAVKNQARSVLLFSKQPIETLSGKKIGVTGESSTSVRLLRILLARRFNVEQVQYVSTNELDCDAILLIGDAALNNRRGLPSCSRVYDLAALWKEWTGLPFVFARWIVRRDLNGEALVLLHALLTQSLERGMKRIDEIAARRTDLSMTVEEVRQYLLGFNYVFGAEEKGAIELFRSYLDAEDRESRSVGEAHNA